MNVLLLNPAGPQSRPYIREGRCEQRLSSFAYRMMPISLPSIGALLRARGHRVTIMDGSVEPLEGEALRRRIRALDPGLIVVSVSTPTFEADRATIRSIVEGLGIHCTALGVHVTALADDALRGSRLDSVVRGEPEVTVAELAGALAGGTPLEQVSGLSFVEDGVVRHNPRRPFIADLDALPTPARDLLGAEDYFLPLPRRPYALVVPSRGCPNRCTFCSAHLYYGHRLRLRRVEGIVDELQEIIEGGVIQDVVMWSDSFTLDRSWVLGICDEIRRRGLTLRWMCNSRVDGMDVELARAMRRAGCTGISFGIESGVQEILDRMRKGTTPAQGRDAVAAARAAGIPVLAQFILGIPGETTETIRQTVAYARELDPDYAQFYCAVPQPGTALWDEVLREGTLDTRDWSRFELNQAILSTPQLSSAALRTARRRAYRAFYLRVPVIRRLMASVELRSWPASAVEAARIAAGWVLDG